MTFIERVGALFSQQRERIAKLEQRVVALEQRPIGVIYRGLWDESVSYAPHEGVTHRGSVFVAIEPSRGVKPEGADGVWRLAVKRGRDGRDGRDAR
jgi:integrin beta 3